MKSKEIIIEVIEANGQQCLAIDDYRVAGGKPWGGGRVVKKWKAQSKDILEALGISNKQLNKDGE